jgi:hypothetical protein
MPIKAAFFNTEAARLPPHVMVNQGLAALRHAVASYEPYNLLENYRYAN